MASEEDSVQSSDEGAVLPRDRGPADASGQERENLHANELHHRLRNMLGLIHSVFARSVATTSSLEELTLHFQGRLETITRFVAREGSRAGDACFDLEMMIHDELLRFPTDQDEALEVIGPRERLPRDTAQALGLALHELATNSVKFGTLAAGSGSLRVSWTRAGDRLALTWDERSPGISGDQNRKYGFGREYIEQGLAYQLDARTSFQLLPSRLLCTIEIVSPEAPAEGLR